MMMSITSIDTWVLNTKYRCALSKNSRRTKFVASQSTDSLEQSKLFINQQDYRTIIATTDIVQVLEDVSFNSEKLKLYLLRSWPSGKSINCTAMRRRIACLSLSPGKRLNDANCSIICILLVRILVPLKSGR